MDINGTPLIYTSKGNVPIDSLTTTVEWQESDEATAFIQEWKDSTGEVVKRSVHVRAKKSLLPIGIGQAKLD